MRGSDEDRSIWPTFAILGPPIVYTVETAMEQYVFPVPGILGLFEARSAGEGFQHLMGNIEFGLPFSYLGLPLALTCAGMTWAIRCRTRPNTDVIAAVAAGLTIAVLMTWSDWTATDGIPPQNPHHSAYNWTVGYLVAAVICGWLTRRKPKRGTVQRG